VADASGSALERPRGRRRSITELSSVVGGESRPTVMEAVAIVFGHSSFAGVSVLGREGSGAGQGGDGGPGEWSGARSTKSRRAQGRAGASEEIQREAALR